MNNPTKKDLGMHRRITRRDFLNGAALTIGAALTPAQSLFGQNVPPSWAQEPFLGKGITQNDPRYYPPALTGMRGSHPGSFDDAHARRDGKSFPGAETDTGERYDLVVVGGGISGLAAAYYFRKTHGPNARILVLDNHDDFGGHAKRNEFNHGNRLFIGYGGTEQIYPGPSAYGPDAIALIQEIGVNTDRFYTAFDRSLYKSLGLEQALFFDKETFGDDRLVTGEGTVPTEEFLAKTPLSEGVRQDIIRLFIEKKDYMPGLTADEKRKRLDRMSYQDYLLNVVKVQPGVVPYFSGRFHRLAAGGADVLSCSSARTHFGLPGFAGLGIPQSAEELRDEHSPKEPPNIFHFPDGNASIARLLVRAMIPDAVPGKNMEDLVTSRADYSRLDKTNASVRIRLNSTGVYVRHAGDLGSARNVDVTYVSMGKAYRVQGAYCILAGYNMMIPYICPEMPEAQRKALAQSDKGPLVYTNVLISNWRSWQKLGVHHILALNSYHTEAKLDFPVSLGDYHFPKSPDEPIVLHLERTPLQAGLPRRDQHRAGRYQLLTTTFETFELNIRDQLGRMLSAGGFDPARDIEAITVNRWPHGVAQGRDPLTDPEWTEEECPWVIGRKRFGRIAIANSDAGARALTQSAIDQALRAVRELSAVSSS